MTAPEPRNLARLGIAATVAAVVLFAAGNLLARETPLPGVTLALHRLWMAALFVGVVGRLRGQRVDLRSLRLSAPGGILFGLNLAAFFTAIKITSVVAVTLVINLQPAMVLVVAGPLFGEVVTRRHVGLAALAMAGTAVVIADTTDPFAGDGRGLILALAALVAWTAYFAVSKRTRRHLDAMEYQASLSLVAAVVVFPIAVASGEPLTFGWTEVGWILLVVLVPGNGHLLLNWAHAHISIVTAAVLTLAVPLLVAVGADVFLDIDVSPRQWAAIIATTAVLALLVASPPATRQPARTRGPSDPSPPGDKSGK